MTHNHLLTKLQNAVRMALVELAVVRHTLVDGATFCRAKNFDVLTDRVLLLPRHYLSLIHI